MTADSITPCRPLCAWLDLEAAQVFNEGQVKLHLRSVAQARRLEEFCYQEKQRILAAQMADECARQGL